MIIVSDACTFQFWLNDQLTYNEEFANYDPQVINRYCYFHPYKYGSEQRVRIISDPAKDIRLRIFDENGMQLEELALVETNITLTRSVYEVVFTPSALNPSLLNSLVSMQLVSFQTFLQSTELLSNPEFDSSLAPWTNEGDGEAFVWNTDQAEVPEGDPAPETSYLFYDFATDLDGWFNEFGSNPHVWAWNAANGGSAKVTTVDTFVPNNLKITGITVPSEPFWIRLKYLITNGNSDNLKLRLNLRSSSNVVLAVVDFDSNELGVERTALQYFSNPATFNTATFILSVSSTDFDAGDEIFVTEFEVFTKTTLPVRRSKMLVDSTSLGNLAAGLYKTSIELSIDPTGPYMRFKIVVDQSGLNPQTIMSLSILPGESPKTVVLSTIINQPFNRIWVQVDNEYQNVDPVQNLFINFLRFEQVDNVTVPILEARTDLITFTNSIKQYQEVFYKATKPHNQMYYNSESPFFSFIIPGVLYHEREITQQKVTELSGNKIITTATEMRIQRLLATDKLPDWAHRKIQLILQHCTVGTVIMRGVQWSIEQGYEKQEPNPHSQPLKSATIYVTRKGYYQRGTT